MVTSEAPVATSEAPVASAEVTGNNDAVSSDAVETVTDKCSEIYLSSEWLDALSVGQHTITFVFKNGTADITIIVKASAEPTKEPTEAPTEEPTIAPTEEPTEAPTEEPTEAPTEAPTEEPTTAPTITPGTTEVIEEVDNDGNKVVTTTTTEVKEDGTTVVNKVVEKTYADNTVDVKVKMQPVKYQQNFLMTEKYCLKMQHGMLNLKFLIQTMLRIFVKKQEMQMYLHGILLQ